jgi:CNT family concentrative nucleoside transporter
MNSIQPVLGILFILITVYFLSENRSLISKSVVLKGLLLQFILALFLLKFAPAQAFFNTLNHGILEIQKATQAGTTLVFGYLGGGPLPFIESKEGLSFILGFQALPMMLVFSALSSLLYYLRVLPVIIGFFAWCLGRVLNISGPASFSVICTIFVGMVEAPLLIKPYLKHLSRTELFIVMSSGLATISGTVLVIYAGFLQSIIPNSAGHLMIASIISAPASIMLSMMLIPQDQTSQSMGRGHFYVPEQSQSYSGIMDAISHGTTQGLKLLANVIAMLIVLVALVALSNSILHVLPNINGEPISLERVIGWFMQPLAWLLGIDAKDVGIAGQLLGTKLVLNEFIAYLNLSKVPLTDISDKSRILLTYLLCGFANFGSLGIVISGLSSMVPERNKEILDLGLKSLLIGTLSTSLSGAIVSLILF